jgi:germination protein M
MFAVAVSLGILLAACGDDRTSSSVNGSGSQPTKPSASSPPPPAENPSTPPDDESETVAYEVWFHAGERLAVDYYEHTATPRIGTAALEDLLAGPNDGHYGTSIPQGTELLDLTITDGIATANLNEAFVAPGGSFEENVRLGQLVFTLTQFPTVEGVLLEIEGQRVVTYGSHGIEIDQPVTRADFDEIAPAIEVDAPRPGATASSPITISGTANVFEATVSIRILDAAGTVIKETFTTATCGTGCRGDYEARVSYAVDEAQDGTVMVFEASAKNGRPINVVKVPVRLVP